MQRRHRTKQTGEPTEGTTLKQRRHPRGSSGDAGHGFHAVRFSDERAERMLDCPSAEWALAGASPDATLVKQNPMRRVYRLDHPKGPLYIKQHFRRGISRRFKDWILGSPAAIEFRAAGYAARCKVPAVNIIAMAERADAWDAHLSVTASIAIDHARPLSDAFLDNSRLGDAAQRRAAELSLSGALSRLLATAHDAAFLHPDNHPGNILVQQTDDGTVACLYVDVYGVRCGGAVSEADAAGNLAALNQWFQRRTTRSQRLRFLKQYRGLRRLPASGPDFRRFARLVRRYAIRHAHGIYRSRDRRIGRSNAYFARLDFGYGVRAAVTLRFRSLPQALQVDPPCHSVEQWRQYLGVRLGTVAGPAERPRHRDAPNVESFFPHSSWSALIWRLLGTPAWRRYRTACMALNRDVPSAGGLACIEWYDGILIDRACWLMLQPAAAASLPTWLAGHEGRIRHRVLDDVGRLLATTVETGLVIRSLRPSSMSVAAREGAPNSVYWTGIEGKALGRPVPAHAWTWMLYELGCNAAGQGGLGRVDAARVLRAYCIRREMTREDDNWKAQWRRIENLARIHRGIDHHVQRD